MTEIDIPAAMEKAADFIEIEGHFGKGHFKTDEGCFCTLGAYAVALGVDPSFERLDDALRERGVMGAFDEGWRRLDETARALGYDVVHQMNDAPETTATDMAGVLRETAAQLRSVG
ncbi:DUF6197 family protein [Kitasatospora aureofaciens]|uniref:DUF6197 family protein n=1 Tax=Kitasatospora aureofaciens TaxID=1894 RepID=UPI0033DB07E1